jgi:hypothetical protein
MDYQMVAVAPVKPQDNDIEDQPSAVVPDSPTLDEPPPANQSNLWSQFASRLGFLGSETSESNAPQLGYLNLFRKFLWFGCRAFGGPVAQIQMMKQELVVDEKWVRLDCFRLYLVILK